MNVSDLSSLIYAVAALLTALAKLLGSACYHHLQDAHWRRCKLRSRGRRRRP